MSGEYAAMAIRWSYYGGAGAIAKQNSKSQVRQSVIADMTSAPTTKTYREPVLHIASATDRA